MSKPDANPLADLDHTEYAGGLDTIHTGEDGEKDREKRCETCRSRVTVGTDGSTEYGHEYGCPERPAELPQTGNMFEKRHGGD